MIGGSLLLWHIIRMIFHFYDSLWSSNHDESLSLNIIDIILTTLNEKCKYNFDKFLACMTLILNTIKCPLFDESLKANFSEKSYIHICAAVNFGNNGNCVIKGMETDWRGSNECLRVSKMSAWPLRIWTSMAKYGRYTSLDLARVSMWNHSERVSERKGKGGS